MKIDEIGARIADGRSYAAGPLWTQFNECINWESIMPIHRNLVAGIVPKSEAWQIGRYIILLVEGTLRQARTNVEDSDFLLGAAAHTLEEIISAEEYLRPLIARLTLLQAQVMEELGQLFEADHYCILARRFMADEGSLVSGLAMILRGRTLLKRERLPGAIECLRGGLRILRWNGEHGARRARMLGHSLLHQAYGRNQQPKLQRWQALLLWRRRYEAYGEDGRLRVATWPADAERMHLYSLDPACA